MTLVTEWARSFFLIAFFLPAISCAVNAQTEIKPEDCGKSEENIKACFNNFVSELKALKSNSQDKVTILKRRFGNDRTKLDPLKAEYEDARTNINSTVQLMKRRNPDFTNIKQQFDTALGKYRKFINDSNVALTGTGVASFGIFDFLIDFGCQVLNVPEQLCRLIHDLFRNLQINQLKWKSWNDIRAV